MVHYGQSKIEFLKNIDEIIDLLKNGFTKLEIFKKLKEEEKITFSKTVFYDYVKETIPKEIYKTDLKEVLKNKTLKPSAPSHEIKTFDYDPSAPYDISKL